MKFVLSSISGSKRPQTGFKTDFYFQTPDSSGGDPRGPSGPPGAPSPEDHFLFTFYCVPWRALMRFLQTFKFVKTVFLKKVGDRHEV